MSGKYNYKERGSTLKSKKKLNREKKIKKLNQENLMLKNQVKELKEKNVRLESEKQENEKQRAETKREEEKMNKCACIYSSVKYCLESVILTYIVYIVAIGTVGYGAFESMIICLIFLMADIIVNGKLNGKNNYTKCYVDLLKDFGQSVIPLLFTSIILYMKKSNDLLNFVKNNFQIGFVIVLNVILLAGLLILTKVSLYIIEKVSKIVKIKAGRLRSKINCTPASGQQRIGKTILRTLINRFRNIIKICISSFIWKKNG